ncbi:hypothetical protein [Aurantibacillus circumpalustris]|uniref:hypothetical protein n=1 Tax=Aurantibacillus circumpalustris TaxID=3036359 RepID=UPI00295AFBF0|nr:hypothetical protein [Aurantibacillus circumpalustris]
MKKIIMSVLLLLVFQTGKSQFYEEQKKPRVARQKVIRELDSAKTYLGAGFVFSGYAGINRGINFETIDYYTGNIIKATTLYDYDWYENYKVKNAFGTFFSISPGIHGRFYGIDFPIMYHVLRFSVPDVSAETMRISEWDFGLINNFKLFQEKIHVVLGFSIGTKGGGYATYGLGYKIAKKMSLDLRIRNSLRLIAGEDPNIHVRTDEGKTSVSSFQISTLQLMLRYDIISTRKTKYKYKKLPRDVYSQDSWSAPQPPVKQTPKPKVNYASYTVAELNDMLKEANSKNDLDAMLGIQKELDARAATSEFINDSDEVLEQKLIKALESEDYKKAELIKKEIQKRKKPQE